MEELDRVFIHSGLEVQAIIIREELANAGILAEAQEAQGTDLIPTIVFGRLGQFIFHRLRREWLVDGQFTEELIREIRGNVVGETVVFPEKPATKVRINHLDGLKLFADSVRKLGLA